MRMTIVPEDSMVAIDGVAYRVDCSDLPNFIHAVQWYGDKGEIEFKADSRGMRQGNMVIVDIAPYSYLVERWQQAKVVREAEIEASKKAEESQRQKVAAHAKSLQLNRKKKRVK